MKRVTELKADDPKRGMNTVELKEALKNVPEGTVKVRIGFKGQIQTLIVTEDL